MPEVARQLRIRIMQAALGQMNLRCGIERSIARSRAEQTQEVQMCDCSLCKALDNKSLQSSGQQTWTRLNAIAKQECIFQIQLGA